VQAKSLDRNGEEMHKTTLLYCAVITFSFISALNGQVDQGSIAGTVKDSSDAVVAGAAVTVKDPQSNLTRSAVSGPNGSYVLPSLPAGTYELAVEAAGFKKFVAGDLRVIAATRTTLDPVLELGQIT